MTYVWKAGSRHNVDANVAGEVCASLEQKGMLSAHNLVEVSRAEDAPLHSCFEWNDTKAAESYREWQARILIRHIEVLEEEDDLEEGESALPRMPVFVNLRTEEHEYEHIRTVLHDEDKRETLLARAKTDMVAFRTKYQTLKELAKVFAAMDEILGGEE